MDSFWINSNEKNLNFDNLNDDIETDVCVIGAGIFGLTCAYYLTNLGYKVCVLEKYKIGEKVSGHSTAKITSQHGLFYDYLLNSYGAKFAKDYLDANEEAIQNIRDIINKEKISCDLKTQNSYVYTTSKKELRAIKKEISALEKIGFQNCEFVTKTGLPFEVEGAVCFRNQAQFNPVKYMYGLAKSISSKNGNIYTNTTATDIKNNENLYFTYTETGVVKSKYVILATHYPFINFPRIILYKDVSIHILCNSCGYKKDS